MKKQIVTLVLVLFSFLSFLVFSETIKCPPYEALKANPPVGREGQVMLDGKIWTYLNAPTIRYPQGWKDYNGWKRVSVYKQGGIAGLKCYAHGPMEGPNIEHTLKNTTDNKDWFCSYGSIKIENLSPGEAPLILNKTDEELVCK